MKRLDARPEMRYHCDRIGLRWHVRAGDGTRSIYSSWRWISAARIASALEEAYVDGHYQERADQREIASYGLSEADFV